MGWLCKFEKMLSHSWDYFTSGKVINFKPKKKKKLPWLSLILLIILIFVDREKFEFNWILKWEPLRTKCFTWKANFSIISLDFKQNYNHYIIFREKVTTTKIRTSKTNQNEREYQKICKQSLHWKCLFSSSLLRQKSDFRWSDFTYGVKKDQNVKNKKHQLPMAYYLWLPRPVGG